MKKIDFNIFSYIILFFMNLLSQWWLLVMRGALWDDFSYIELDINVLSHQFMQMGQPSRIFTTSSVWSIPNDGYRIVVFFYFFIMSILFYKILNKIRNITKVDALIISILFIIIPLNTARLNLCTYSYSLALLLFFISFFVLQYYLNNKKILLRIILLILFLLSFTLNSLLFFYGIVLIYIIYNYNNKFEFSIHYIKKCVLILLKYIDFILMPIIFFLVKNICFPTYGNYKLYNNVSFVSILNAFKNSIIGFVPQIILVMSQFFNFIYTNKIRMRYIILIRVFLVTIIFLILFLIQLKYKKVNKNNKQKFIYIKFIIVSLIIFIIGMFPYITVHNNMIISVSGEGSRDSMLLPIGLSIFIYYFCKLIFSNIKLLNISLTIIIILGIVSFNYSYMGYQGQIYWNKSFMEAIKKNKDIENNSTFLVTYNQNWSEDYGTRFYTLNGISKLAFGNQKRFFLTENMLNEKLNFEQLENMKYNNSMGEYNLSNNLIIDGDIYFDCQINRLNVLHLKFLEIFNHSDYEKYFYNNGILYYREHKNK